MTISRGMVALVDDDQAERLRAHRWYASPNGHTTYVYAYIGRQTVYMHRLIAGAPPGMDVDHRDGNGLNNQRENLRLVKRGHNNANQHHGRRSKCGYRGVREVG